MGIYSDGAVFEDMQYFSYLCITTEKSHSANENKSVKFSLGI